MAEMLTVINAESWDDFDGPHEVFPEYFEKLDRTDPTVMHGLAEDLTASMDGTYIVRTVREVEARRAAK